MKAKVLIVDDEQEIVDFLERFLKRFNITVFKTTKSEEVIELYGRHAPNWVFLDIQMPEKDGLTTLKDLRKEYPHAKVIMVTGKEEKEFQERAKRYGAVDYITKPLDLSELIKKVQEHILEGKEVSVD
jgi:DNA-binding response OmpR family regulator